MGLGLGSLPRCRRRVGGPAGGLDPLRAARCRAAGRSAPGPQPLGAHRRRSRLPHQHRHVPARADHRGVRSDPAVGRLRVRRIPGRVRAGPDPAVGG
jgi:hypothetical protein